jgi:DNA invertase Pin-like site-specific DNA recombinase
MNAIAYLRVSTTDQAESGAGLAAQSASCAAYAAKAGINVIGTFTDAAISGAAGLEDRPGLMAAVAGLRRGDVLLIAKRDRLGRDQMAVLMIEKAVSRKGAAIVSADGMGNGDDAGSIFMRQVIDAAAVYERNLIKARTKAALAAKRKAGERVGEVPFGWTLDAAGHLVEDADEQNVLAKIMACRQAGMSLRKIAAILTGAGCVTKKGNAAWSHSTVQSILERAAAIAA